MSRPLIELGMFSVGLLIYAAIFVPPLVRILRRVGLSRWWVLLFFVPLLNLVGLWLLAWGKWPAEQTRAPTKGTTR